MTSAEWDIYVVTEVREWIDALDMSSYRRVVQALDALVARYAEALGGRLHQAIYFDDGDIAAIA